MIVLLVISGTHLVLMTIELTMGRDAALACLILLENAVSKSCPSTYIQNLVSSSAHDHISVLELGAGCGAVGIALATLIPGANVVMTDLPDAMSVIDMNLLEVDQQIRARLQRRTLDWADLDQIADLAESIDLVVVADCVYNTDSIPLLVGMLEGTVKLSPTVKILVVRKPRHSSEMLFYDMLQEVPLGIIENFTVDLPQCIDLSIAPPRTVEFHLYGHP